MNGCLIQIFALFMAAVLSWLCHWTVGVPVGLLIFWVGAKEARRKRDG